MCVFKKMTHWLNERFPLGVFFRKQFLAYQVPNNLNLMYVFGVLLLLTLSLQLISGIWLAFFYTPTAALAFDSIQTIMRDVHSGWLFRYMHTTGASLLFVLLYLHLFRGLLYQSYQKPRELVWLLGMMLFVLLTMEACFGYLLPWGQLSYWGAQVLTSFLGAIPYVGKTLMLWFRGDYAVSDVTLHRFYILHIIVIPLLVAIFVKLHIQSLRHVGSSNPTGVPLLKENYIPFHPYYTVKDALAACVFLGVFFSIVCFIPMMWGYFIDPNNSVPANFLQTPENIVPLWYMAPFYGMLRAIPNKGFGILVLLLSMMIWLLLPWLDKSGMKRFLARTFLYRFLFVLFICCFIGLGVLGLLEITPARLWLARLFLIVYFSFFLLLPWVTRRDNQ